MISIQGQYNPMVSFVKKLLENGNFEKICPASRPNLSDADIIGPLFLFSFITLIFSGIIGFSSNQLWMAILSFFVFIYFISSIYLHEKIVVSIDTDEEFNKYQFNKYGSYRRYWSYSPILKIIETGLLSPLYLLAFFAIRLIVLFFN